MSNRYRKNYKKFRVTEDENNRINKLVEESPFKSFQQYALNTLIQSEVIFIDYSHLQDLITQVKRLGNNINQITKLAHQFDEISAQDINNLTVQLKEVTSKLEKEFDREKGK